MKILLSAIAVLLSAILFANPGWKRVALTKSTIFNGIVTFNGEPASEGDVVAAFVDGECRMAIVVKNDGTESSISGILHSEASETAVLKYWNASENKTYIVDTTITTIPDGEVLRFPVRIGKASQLTETGTTLADMVVVYPTICDETITVESVDPIKEITLIGMNGVNLSNEIADGQTSLMFSVAELKAGKYTVSVTFVSGKSVLREIIKE